MKKFKLIMAVMALSLLAACGNSSGGTKSKNQVAEVVIEEGAFIDPIGGDSEEEQDVIALKVKVKNTSKDKMYLFDQSFYLIEKGKDEKITPMRLDYESNIKEISGDLSPGKSQSGTVAFIVEEDKKYELVFSSNGFDEKGKGHDEVETTLDLSEYDETKEHLEDPSKALQAYIDVVFLAKENADYDKLVANDVEADCEMVKKEYIKGLKDSFYSYRVSDDESSKAFESYVGNQSDAVEVTLKSAGNVSNMAKVNVDFKGIARKAVADGIDDFEEEYDDKNNNYEPEKREQYALSKLEEVYSNAEVGEPRDELAIVLTKKEDKWFIDFKSEDAYQNKQLIRAYLGDVN